MRLRLTPRLSLHDLSPAFQLHRDASVFLQILQLAFQRIHDRIVRGKNDQRTLVRP